MKNVFPKEILEYSVELHRYNNLQKTNTIYIILLLVVLTITILVPFIYVDIYSSTPGQITPRKGRNQIISPINGKVQAVYISENLLVNKGDTLIIFDSFIIDKKIALAKNELDTCKSFSADLHYLLKFSFRKIDSLHTGLFRSEFLSFKEKLYDLKRRFRQKNYNFNRQKKLFDKGVIAAMEYQKSVFDLDLAVNNIEYHKEQQKAIWQDKLKDLNSKILTLQSLLLNLEKKKGNYYITASIAGSIYDLTSIEVGNYLYSNAIIGEISPGDNLVVECFVSSRDIGLLQPNLTVKFQVDAFHHNQWGMATGNIIEISNDASIVNRIPMFKVICSLNETQLFLKNKTPGNLRKGMTLKARFYITKRTLFQLLFDTVEDWYVPS